MTGTRAEPIAIVGMSVLFPGAPDLATYWQNLVSGVDAITEVPPGRWDADDHYAPGAEPRADRVYCRRGGFVDELAEVDVTEFGIMPAAVPATEPDQLIALKVAAQAIADAGGADRLPADRHRVGVVLGRGGYLTPGLVRLDQRVRTASQLVRTLGELLPDLGSDQLEAVRQAFTDRLGPEAPESSIGLVPNLAASRLAGRLDLRGPAYTVDAACASSLIAVDHAVRELASGRCDLMLAGGVHHCHDITFWSVFSQLGALSPSERIRPFHKGADGVLIGEGTGVVVLKRLADAERDGDRIYAAITGTGVASDGRTTSLMAPDSGGQVRAVRQAWEAAGLDPAAPGSIGLLEAHGTATPAGDGTELTTLAEVFGPPPEEATADRPAAVIGSVKSMIGHTMPAAGVAGLVKAALAVHHGVLPPTLHCDDPHPALARTRFTPIGTARPWHTDVRQPVRRAAVNAFGFGGINAHVVLEQVAARAKVEVYEPERVLRLTAPTTEAMAALLDRDDATLLAVGLDERAATTGADPVRLAVVGPTAKRLALARKAVAKGKGWRGRNDVWFVPRPLLGPGGGKLAFVFPGLEAEFTPNSTDVARHFGLPDVADATVGDVGRQGTGVFELGRLLDATLRRLGVVPDALAGHSLGEWTAMAAAGIHAPDEVDAFLAGFDPDALSVPGLAFAAIGAPAEQVLRELSGRGDVVLSHDNSPNQSMICGPEPAVGELVDLFRSRAVISQILPFRSGFHTPMLEPYLDPIRKAAEAYSLHPARLPLWSATTIAPYPAEPAAIRALFTRHLLEPVRFRPLVDTMYAAGFRAFVQLGAGQLGSLIADTLHGREHLVVPAHSPHRAGLPQLHRVASALWADGAAPELAPLLGIPETAAPVVRRRPIKLDLGSATVSLDAKTRSQVGAALTRHRTPDPEASLNTAELGEQGALGAELSALLRDATALASDVVTASRLRRRPGPPSITASRTPTEPDTRPRPLRPLEATLQVSVDTMPYLLDHCFFKQPAQAEPADSWPVVPGTTVIAHLMDFAERAAPGRHAVAVHDVGLHQWVTATPAVEIPVRIVPEGPDHPDRVTASLGSHARAVVELAAEHGQFAPAAPWTFPAALERKPDLTAAELYTRRWMFHGPRFQGVSELTAIGDRHVRGVLVTPPAPGALLDNVGQLLGYWIMSSLPVRTTVFPVGMKEIRFHGPQPAPGEPLECLIKITSVTDAMLEADMQLVQRGRVWAEFTGWQDRRFDSNPRIRAMDREPELHTLSLMQPGGWALVHEEWPDLATRELIMRNILAGEEREQYAAHAPRGRRQWLLGRIAVKDTVRHLMWDGGAGPVFPAEVRVGNDPAGRPFVTGGYGRTLPALHVSLAHRGETAVAMARTDGPCGIDIEEITDRPEGTLAVALTPRERELLRALTGETAETLWFTRFWAAKEAVAKARGTGLGGEPKQFEITAADGTLLTVRAAGEEYRVRHCELTAPQPSGHPGKEYVVAWTAVNDQENEDDH
ncbi:beta-ketoacyl synthase N-terminal-like domain-containing protein [Streptomyces sp. NBC_00038]|uniref:beta-ketoacyl synthase N-terminal-like domain-containing protein n=1 Tax=Streptomyces sp. NBC_00038 TaxID=2903615 RepID=UPI00224D7258|nr:beta-ketoacyl synthase N-terminal-like domain-containing protein [Streptomyces sp. NBC_00038]MCX5562684.1 polyketide synthase dehydratase domain-containing protein [Streptomyces sp. NBC_00038]